MGAWSMAVVLVFGRCCIDNIFTLNELIQGCLKEGKKTFSFFLHIQKAYDSVWRKALWLKLWNMGVKGKMWRVIKTENLQQLIDIIYDFCSKWRLHANVNKSVVLVFGKDKVKGNWNWGDHVLPIVSNYTYLGVDFSYNGAWDTHIKKLIQNGKQKVNQLNSIISNRYINLSARRMLLLSVLRPSLEYGSEVALLLPF